MSAKFETLKREVLRRSTPGKSWDEALSEWGAGPGTRHETRQKCLCTHDECYWMFPIQNARTGATAEVGSKCVQHFLGPLPRMRHRELLRETRRRHWQQFQEAMWHEFVAQVLGDEAHTD